MFPVGGGGCIDVVVFGMDGILVPGDRADGSTSVEDFQLV